MPILRCKDLVIGYNGQPQASSISFKLQQGEYLAVVGENGIGKSTLIKTLLGLIPPVSGELKYNSCIKGIGYLPQQSNIQKDFPATVWEVVLTGTLAHHKLRLFYNQEAKDLALEALEKLNILDLKDKCYRELSGGQQQRVLLARALCASKDLLILDEPVTGLDSNATALMYNIIKSLNVEQGITIIMITHNLEDVFEDITHVLKITRTCSIMQKKGAMQDDSNTSELF